MRALAEELGRRVVLMFTDGHDNPNEPEPDTRNTTFPEVRAQVQSDDVMVYGIGLAEDCGTPDSLPGFRFRDSSSDVRPGAADLAGLPAGESAAGHRDCRSRFRRCLVAFLAEVTRFRRRRCRQSSRREANRARARSRIPR